MQAQSKPVILLVAEAVTLAHFARIITLAKALNPALYQIIVASDSRYINLSESVGHAFHPIHSISTAEFTHALACGKPLYTSKTLVGYVEEELALFKKIKPDLVIGDFRLSLAISAPLCRMPYAAVVNAYWSPYAKITYPVPDLPMTRILGAPLAQKLFDMVRPLAFALHARPLNQARRFFGLPSLGSDLRNIYTWGDYTLYADSPTVIPIRNLPANHHYLGPVLWSARTALPEWWDHLPKDKPLVFVTLGSSGQADLLPVVLAALSALSVTVVVATARKITLVKVPDNTYVAEYLPVDIVTQHARLIICNGGSLTTYQALVSSVPVIGLCSNMDQLLNMGAVERLGAGILLRAAKVTADGVLAAVNTVLQNSLYAETAGQISRVLPQYNAEQRFQTIVTKMLC